MAVEVRACTPDDVRDGISPIFHFFGRRVDEATADRFARVLAADRVHAAFDGGAAVGGAGAFPFELTVPGGRVRAGGVTLVGVLPTHRRRGILTQLMRAQLDSLHERGEPVAYLWASEGVIYPRFGYGVASLGGAFSISRTRGAFAIPFEPAGQVRLVGLDEALELFPPLYERVAVETPGMFARTRAWWESRVLADPEWRREGAGELQRAVLEVDGRAEAYALYRLKLGFEYGNSTGETAVVEAIAATPAANREIWRYLLDVDWMDSVRASLLPVDHPLWLLLAEPRRMRFTVGDALWVRLVDVGEALRARGYQAGEPVVLEIADGFCPWNEGRWRVGDGSVERVDEEPGLRMDVNALGSVYFGGFTFAQLARALRVEELRPGALAVADALFRTDRAPWCPEIF